MEAYIKDIQAYAPADGEVANVLLSEGELSPTGFPVVMLVDTKDVWLRVAVSEEYLKDFQKDSEFSAYIPALQKEVRFRVRYVSVMGDFATWRATSNSKGYDLRSFEIEARPLHNEGEFAVGMSAIITLPPR